MASQCEVGDHDAADRYFTESLELARRLRHGLGQQSRLEWLGKVAAARATPAAAHGDLTAARRLSEAALDDSRADRRMSALT